MCRLKVLFILGILFPFLVNSKEPLYTCGINTGIAFNGWRVEPFSSFTNISFEEETISFYMENGGDYTIELTRKIPAMLSANKIDFSLGFDNFENAKLDFVDLFISADGKEWKCIPINQSELKATIVNNKQNEYLKIAAHVSFKKHGYMECTFIRIEDSEALDILPTSKNPELTTPEFFIFFFNKTINIETKSEVNYTLVITSLTGQIVYNIELNGSDRIEPNLANGTYVVSVLQNNTVVKSKKIIVSD